MRLSMSMPPSNRSIASPSRSDGGDSPSPILAVHEYYSPQPRGLHEPIDTSARHSSASATTFVDLSDIRELLLSVKLHTTSIKEDQQAFREQIVQEVSAVREDVQLLRCQVDSLATQLEEAPRGRSPQPKRPLSSLKSISPEPVVHSTPAFLSRSPSPDTSSVGYPSTYSPERPIASVGPPPVESLSFIRPIFSPRSPRTPSEPYTYQQPADPVSGSAPRSSPKFPSLADSPLPPTLPIPSIGCPSPESFIFNHSGRPSPTHCGSTSSSLFGHRKTGLLDRPFSPSPPRLRSSVRIKTPTSATKTPSPLITYKHPLFLRNPVAMEAQVPSSLFPPMPAPKLTTAFDTYSDAPMGEKSPIFLPSPQSSLAPSTVPYNHVIKYEAVPTPQPICIPTYTAPSPYRSPTLTSPSDPWSKRAADQPQARPISSQPPSPSIICADPASPTSPERRRLVISPVNSLGLEDYPVVSSNDSKVATEELMQEMKAMFRAFKTDIEKDSEALRDRIKDLEERLAREKAKHEKAMSKGSEEPQSGSSTIIIPPTMSSVPPAAGGPEVFTAAPSIPVAPTNKGARVTSPRTSPTAPTSGTYKPWVSTPPVDTSIHMPPIMPPSSAQPPFVSASIPGGWKATKPRGLPRSSTIGDLSNNYHTSSPVMYPNFSYGGMMGNPLPTPPGFASYPGPPTLGTQKKRNSTPTSMISSHRHPYPSAAAPLRRSRTEATVMPQMHYATPPSSSQSYPVLSQPPPMWHSFAPPHMEPPPMPTIMPPPPPNMPVSISQEPSYPITYGGAPLGI